MKITQFVEHEGVTVKGTFEIDVTEASRTKELGMTIDDDADARISSVLRRECQRAAEITLVNLNDQKIARAEAERVRQADPNRSHVVIAAGTKDPAAVQVLRGSVKVGNQVLKAPPAPKGGQQ